MISIVACLVDRHDPLAVLAAAVICAAASLSATLLLRAEGRVRLVVAALAIGAGAWATHFVALLAYDPGLPIGFAPGPTLLSAALAVAGSLAGLWLWSSGATPFGRRAVGGAVLGLGIAGMHYLGMTAVLLPGRLSFAPEFVLASLVLASAVGAAALAVLRPDAGWGRRTAGACLLAAAIVSLHFTGMGGVEVWLDPEVAVPPAALPRIVLVALVTLVSAAALVATLAVLALEARLALASQVAEASRLRGLADAAFEALALLDGEGRVVDASTRLATLVGTSRASLIGRSFTSLLQDGESEDGGTTTLTSGIPVELRRRQIETAAGTRTVVALRDLRERVESENLIRHLAHHDALTGLANRTLLMLRLDEEQARVGRGAEGFAVHCLDLDRFKPVNDVYGHAAGDRLLRQVADRLRELVRQGDLCARLGGDEFAVVQTLAGQPAAAQALAERIVETLSQPFDLGDVRVSMSASVGVALYPADAPSPDELLRAADVALYRVKEGGRCGFTFFQVEMDRELRKRRALEDELRQAPARGEMTLAWQPQADSTTGAIVGFEALLRWNHPQRGFVPPDAFISVAEASGAIIPIGAWVLESAAREAASWPRPLRVAVNVSTLQVQQGDFLQVVERVLEETGLAPSRLELEVTESLLITDADRALSTLQALKALGVRVSLDDFGTGYSSLGMLMAFPFDKVKMDRSFVSRMTDNPQAEAIVRSILGLSRGMGLPVTAEGVETEAQARMLRTEQCAEIQGFLIGRPQAIGTYDAIVGREAALVVA